MDGIALKIIYEGTDITADVSPMCTTVRYTDFWRSQSDELELEFEDTNGLWRSAWNPKKGHGIEVMLGPSDVTMLDCGSFEIDEVSFFGPPDTVRLKCLATGINPGYRTQATKFWENKTLGTIAGEVADKYGLEVVGAPVGVSIASAYQNGEDDLRFLRRLAERYGYAFKVARGRLVFFKADKLEGKETVILVKPETVKEYEFTSEGQPVTQEVSLKYYDPKRKGLVEGSAINGAAVGGERVRLDVKAGSRSELDTQAQENIKQRKRDEETITVTVTGNITVIAGATAEVSGFGMFDGRYLIKESLHEATRDSGYLVRFELGRAAS